MSNQTKTTIIEKFISIQSIEDRYNSCPSMYEYMGKQQEEPDEVDIKIRLRYSLEQNQEEFSRKQEKFKTKIKEIKEEYIKWIDDIDFYDNRTPNAEELEREKNAIKDIIKYIDERMDPERFFENGPDDTELCGKFIIKMERDGYLDEDIIDMVCLLSALQWLMRKEAEICSGLSSSDEKTGLSDEENTDIEEDEDTVMLRQQIEKLGLLNEEGVGKEFYPLLYTLRDAWQIQNKTWAIDNTKFGKKVAPILGKIDSTIAKGLNRACEHLRKNKNSLECYPLSTLRAKEIGIHGEKYKMEELKKWQERLKKINAVMS